MPGAIGPRESLPNGIIETPPVRSTTLTIRRLPRSYVERPEFQPRVPNGGANGAWLPCVSQYCVDPLQVERGSLDGPFVASRSETLSAIGQGRSSWSLASTSAVTESLRRLENPDARMVVTGQQPGFLGGPLLTVFKAVTAIALASRLEREQGTPWIPVFWIASEDHDLEEVRPVRLPSSRGTETFELPGNADRRPLSEHVIDAEVQAIAAAVQAHLADRRHGEEIAELLDCYATDGTRHLGSAFAALLESLFASHGLVVVAPEWLRTTSLPVVRRALERPDEILECISAGIAEVRGAGLRPQVRPRFPLFHLERGDDGILRRHHMTPRDGGFEIDGTGARLSADDAVETLEREPASFSPGVLLRAVVQQACLPVGLAVGGPAELAYFAQSGPLFEHFGLSQTPMTVRLHGAMIEGKVARAIRRLGPEDTLFEALTRSSEMRDVVVSETSDTSSELSQLSSELQERLDRVVDRALDGVQLAEDQERRLRRGGKKIVDELERFGRRLERMSATADEERLAAARLLWTTLFPDGGVQERRWSALHFISKYGRAWIDDLIEAVAQDPDTTDHRWIYFED